MSKEATLIVGTNVCKGKKPIHSDPAGTNGYFNNIKCAIDGVTKALEQAGANVTAGYTGGMINATDRQPITDPYWKAGLCPVNVHWHLGAEHLSMGEFDENGKGPGYYAATGRSAETVALARQYLSANQLFAEGGADDYQIQYSKVLHLDLRSVEPCVSGPKRCGRSMRACTRRVARSFPHPVRFAIPRCTCAFQATASCTRVRVR